MPDTTTHQATLSELTAMAMDIARAIHADATAPETTAAARTEAAAAFDRVARCVRRTVLLADHLARPAAPRPDTAGARRHILRAVENDIARADTVENPDALRRELTERLDSPDLEADLLARPAAEIATDIARDLGVDPFQRFSLWPRRTPADIARLHAQAAGATDPAAPAWTRSPTPSARPGPRGPDGFTRDDRDLHATILAMGRRPRPHPA